jgi:hypothetical protein
LLDAAVEGIGVMVTLTVEAIGVERPRGCHHPRSRYACSLGHRVPQLVKVNRLHRSLN